MFNRSTSRDSITNSSPSTPPIPLPFNVADVSDRRAYDNGPVAESRFVPKPFQYNARVAISLLPAALVMIGAGGSAVLVSLLVGLMISYILDALQLKHGAFLAMWGSLLATAGAAFFSGLGFGPHVPLYLSLLILGSSFHLIFLCGAWASLQFKWVQLEHPTVVVALERILFTCCPITGTVIQTWGVVAASGISNAPFFLMPIMFLHYWMFSLPHTSSFRSSPAVVNASWNRRQQAAETVLSAPESFAHALLVLLLPITFHFAIHHYSILTTASQMSEQLSLVFIPLLFLLFASTRGGLSWLISNPRILRNFQVINGAASVAVLLACIEVRVIFTSFSHYIPLSFPWNYALVSLALYSTALALGAHSMSLLPAPVTSAAVSLSLVTAAVAGSIVLGMPWQAMAFPIIAAVGLSQFLASARNSLPAVVVTAAGISGSALWFVDHHFGFLHTRLAGLPLAELSRLLFTALVLAMAVPASTLLSKAQILTSLLLMGQAALVTRVEEGLYTDDSGEGVYPSFLVILTTGMGVLIARHLFLRGHIQPWALWITCCIYTTKLSLLLFPTTQNLTFHVLLLLLTTTAPLGFPNPAWQTGGSRVRMLMGGAHMVSVALAVWVARSTVLEGMLTWTGHIPRGTVFLAVLTIVWASATVPLLMQHFSMSHHHAARRGILLVVTAALLLLLLQPPLPTFISHLLVQPAHQGGHFDDAEDDIAMYTVTSQPGSTSASWLLLASLLASMAAATSALPATEYSLARGVYSVVVAITLGLYLSLQFFSSAPLLHPLLLILVLTSMLILVFTYWPSASSPTWTPALFALLLLLLPSSYLILPSTISIPSDTSASHTDHDTSDYYFAFAVQELRSSLLGVFCTVFLLIALAVKLKLNRRLRDKQGGNLLPHLPQRSPFAPKHRNIQMLHAGLARAVAGVGGKPGSDSLGLTIVGNLSTIVCFVLALNLNQVYAQGSEQSIIAIATVLLLLVPDGTILAPPTDRQRYFPVTLAISVYLLGVTAVTMFQEVYFSVQVSGYDVLDNYAFTSSIKSLLLALLALPNHCAFNKYLWDFLPQSDYLLLLITPLTLPGVFLSATASVRFLSCTGLLFAVVQFFISRHVRIAGLKYI